MKILSVKQLFLPEIKVIRFARFDDTRGYFTELYRESDFFSHPEMKFMNGFAFHQINESYSQKGTVRGLHFQWKPMQGKLIRTIMGHMIDLILDIRKNSPTRGKIIAYDIPSHPEDTYQDWVWIPPGFAHGNFFPEPTTIQYFCTQEYGPGFETSITPFAPDIDWSACDPQLKQQFDTFRTTSSITDKDKNGYSMESWLKTDTSNLYTIE